jgi:hypothetical protein
MSNDLVKKACESAEKEFVQSKEEQQVAEVKKIVKRTLEKVEKLKKERAEVDEQIKILKMDLDDLKEGHLERVAERQEKDERAKGISVVVIIKEKVIERDMSPWYWPYRITWNERNYPINPIHQWTCTNTAGEVTYGCDSGYSNSVYLNNSVAKNNAIGTYDVSGDIVHFR